MSIWGDSHTIGSRSEWRLRQRSASAPERPVFIPISSQVRAVRRLLKEFHWGANCAVIHGPSGSGRTMMAHQLLRCLGDSYTTIDSPALSYSESDLTGFINQESNPNRRTKRLLVDSLTLRHQGWQEIAGLGEPSAFQKILVTSTAWWLHHSAWLDQNHVVSVGLRLLDRDEIEQLANAVRWMHRPRLAGLNPAEIHEIDLNSEGLAREVTRLAEALPIR